MGEAAEAYRRWGYLQAGLDPLGRLAPLPLPDLDSLAGPEVDAYRAIYCGPIGIEFMHIPDPERRRWLQERMESAPQAPDRGRVLERIIRAECFEQAIQGRYIGTKRFSLEGMAGMIPLLDTVIEASAEQGCEQAVIGMSHRGRLNTVVQVVGRRPAEVFARFEDVDARSVHGSGDVKYHLGATGTYTTPTCKQVAIHLASNPSHLEAVDPAVLGRVRAKQDRAGANPLRVVPILLHGDAAFAGQGILAETLNLATLPGYAVGGTIHVILNNLIGFTTTPDALHASRYASDVARRTPIPIIHVNGEDPEAVVRAARLAADYRAAFGSDTVIDLIGYRRHGHSEIEDPTTTQPVTYRKIKDLPPLWQSYARRIGADDAATQVLVQRVREEYLRELDEARTMTEAPVLYALPDYWSTYVGGPWRAGHEVPTAVPRERLLEVAKRITTLPEGFTPHPKVKAGLEQRLQMAAGAKPVDWGMAEALAFGSLLWDGTRVRLTGQDSRRGTFNQRHTTLFDHVTGAEYMPLEHLHPSQAWFTAYDSPLSEAAALGFEYGYSRDYPEALVLWEAQFGDFANNAQAIIDQFIAAGEAKWGLLSGLTLLLPHGHEGQGPEHSSARIERWLQLAADDNIQACQPSTAGQYFHLLRRQALRQWRKPLIIFTPKSLLRNPAACSSIDVLATGGFQPVLPDTGIQDADRVVLCTGKVSHELRAERQKRGDTGTAVITLEQLYPFPERELEAALQRYANAKDLVWVQEEPANMGALAYVLPRLERLASGRHVRTIKRSASASPATGSAKAHALQQATLLALAFNRNR
jgi:2-oxoglutarate dehydrogenase E1 component